MIKFMKRFAVAACLALSMAAFTGSAVAQDSPVQCPRFNAGDGMFFDHYNLHRTGFGQSPQRPPRHGSSGQ